MPDTIKTIIVEDEITSRAISEIIRENIPHLEVVSVNNSIEQAYTAILRHRPDLVILGLKWEGGHGFDLLKKFRETLFYCILLSSGTEDAAEAFRYSVADYLLKPITPADLSESVKKVHQQMGSPLERKMALERDSNHIMNGKLVIFNTKGFAVINTADIIYCEAESYCTNFHLTGSNRISSSHNLKHYESILPGDRFLRVHNSFIINKEHVKGYSHMGEIQLSENKKCSLSSVHKKAFFAAFGKYGRHKEPDIEGFKSNRKSEKTK